MKRRGELEPEDFARLFANVAASEAREEFLSAWQRTTACCESPIEKVFVAGLHRALNTSAIGSDAYVYGAPFSGDERPLFAGLHIWPQTKIGRYRADFYAIAVFSMRENRGFFMDGEPLRYERFAVELDGHDFHERTKEQAARDRRRDRDMAIAGIRVVRFTGSEVWADPLACGDDFIEIVGKAMEAPSGQNSDD